MNILKYVGLYLLVGFVLHMGWTIIFEMWIHRKVGGENFYEAITHYLGLKMRLYDKHAGLKEAKLFLEGLSEKGAAAIILLIILTTVTWPAAFFEYCAVYSDMVEYCYDVANNKESSGS